MQTLIITEHNRDAFLAFVPRTLLEDYPEDSLLMVGAADDDGMALGVTVFAEQENGLNLIWTYVAEPERGRGICDAMIMELLQRLIRVEGYHILRTDFPEAGCPQLRRVLEGIGFGITEGSSLLYEFTLEQAKTLLELAERESKNNVQRQNKGVIALGKATDAERRRLEKSFALLTDIQPIPTPVDWKKFEPSLSQVQFSGLKPQGCLLWVVEGRDLSLAYAYAELPTSLLRMLLQSLAVAKKCKFSGKIRVSTARAEAASIVEKLVPDIRPTKVVRAEYILQGYRIP